MHANPPSPHAPPRPPNTPAPLCVYNDVHVRRYVGISPKTPLCVSSCHLHLLLFYRIDEYFPFTEPSFELEIFYNGDWMEARHEYVGGVGSL